MKKVLAIIALAAMSTACGIPKQLAKDCGGDLELGCRTLFGTPDNNDDLQSQIQTERNRNDDQDKQIEDLKSRVSVVEVSIDATEASLTIVNTQLQSLYTAVGNLNNATATQAGQISALQAQQNALLAQIVTLQSQANSAQAQLTVLNSQDSIIDYLDCGGDGPGYDEVVLRTKSGKLVAYFESGSTRFLSVLTPGSYQTTDSQHCSFTVDATMKFCDSVGCR